MNGWVPATLVGVLAQEAPRNTGPEFGKASPFGLMIVVFLLVAVFFLVWSMNRHLRGLPENFDPEHPEPDQAADDGTLGDDGAPAAPGPAGEDPPHGRDGAPT